MTIFDPLEPLRRTIQEMRNMLSDQEYAMDILRRTGVSISDKTIGEIGVLFSHFDELGRANQAMLKQDLTQGEIELRRTIGQLLDRMIEVLRQLRGL